MNGENDNGLPKPRNIHAKPTLIVPGEHCILAV